MKMHNVQHEGVAACADTSGFSLDSLVLCGNGMHELVS